MNDFHMRGGPLATQCGGICGYFWECVKMGHSTSLPPSTFQNVTRTLVQAAEQHFFSVLAPFGLKFILTIMDQGSRLLISFFHFAGASESVVVIKAEFIKEEVIVGNFHADQFPGGMYFLRSIARGVDGGMRAIVTIIKLKNESKRGERMLFCFACQPIGEK